MASKENFQVELTFREKSLRRDASLGYRLGSGGKSLAEISPPDEPMSYENLRTKHEYVIFGRFPQTVKPRRVSIYNEIGHRLFNGSDGEIYCQKLHTNIKQKSGYYFDAGPFSFAQDGYGVQDGRIPRYSDGQSKNDTDYFRMDPIKWRVVNRENGILTLLCENVLFYCDFALKSGKTRRDSMFFDSLYKWESSKVRDVLNNDFYNVAFSGSESRYIIPTPLGAREDDSVFILSKQEFASYRLNNCDLARHMTDFCGCYLDCMYGPAETSFSRCMIRPENGQKGKEEYYCHVAGAHHRLELGNLEDYDFVGIVPAIRVRESDVTVYSHDSNGTSKTASSAESATAAYSQDDVSSNTYASSVESSDGLNSQDPAKQEDAPPTFSQKVLYSVLAFVFSFVGLIIALILSDGFIAGNAIIPVGYLVVTEVLIWKLKAGKKFIFLVALSNIAFNVIYWLIVMAL